MRRANAIVVGVAVLVPLILGIEAYALFGAHHRPQAAELAETPAPAAPDLTAAVTAPAAPPQDDTARVKAAAPPPEVADPEATVTPVLEERQRTRLLHQHQIVRDADEQVFDSLGFPDGERAAIRAIDDRYVSNMELMEKQILVPGADFRNSSVDLNPEQTRRTAISNLLGPDRMQAFNTAERRAEQDIRRQLRPQLVRGH